MASAPPPVVSYPRPQLEGGGPACPKCSGTQTKEIKYTWWGGVLAPKLMKLQKCEGCGFLFNRETNKPVTGAIVGYNMTAAVLAFVIFFVVRGMF